MIRYTAADVRSDLTRAIERAEAKGDFTLASRVRARLPHAAAIATDRNREMEKAEADEGRRAYHNDW